MENFQDTFETPKRSFISAFSVCMTVPEKLENYEFSRFLLCRQLYRFKDTKRIALDYTEFRNQVHYRMFMRGIDDRFILTDLVILYTRFGIS